MAASAGILIYVAASVGGEGDHLWGLIASSGAALCTHLSLTNLLQDIFHGNN